MWRINSERKKGLHFEEDPKFRDVSAGESYSKWHFITGVIPIVAVIVSLNFINWRKILSWTEEAVSASDETNYKLVISLLIAIALCCVLNLKRCRKLIFEAINDGSQSSLAAIMNTSCAVGFGNVVKTVTGFELLNTAVLSIPGNVLISETIAMNVLCGATGSASGGLTITLDALGKEYLARAAAQGISPEALHRIASVASGGLDTMPHNGAVITLLAVSNCTQKESFLDMFVTVGIIPLLASPILALIGGIIA